MKSRSHEYDLSTATWHKSTYSGGDGGDCLEVATGLTGIVPVRDSKTPTAPALVFQAGTWATFIDNEVKPQPQP